MARKLNPDEAQVFNEDTDSPPDDAESRLRSLMEEHDPLRLTPPPASEGTGVHSKPPLET